MNDRERIEEGLDRIRAKIWRLSHELNADDVLCRQLEELIKNLND